MRVCVCACILDRGYICVRVCTCRCIYVCGARTSSGNHCVIVVFVHISMCLCMCVFCARKFFMWVCVLVFASVHACLPYPWTVCPIFLSECVSLARSCCLSRPLPLAIIKFVFFSFSVTHSLACALPLSLSRARFFCSLGLSLASVYVHSYQHARLHTQALT